jgi:hypothetical protein
MSEEKVSHLLGIKRTFGKSSITKPKIKTTKGKQRVGVKSKT